MSRLFRLCIAATVMVSCALPAAADTLLRLDDLVARSDGAVACWRRDYDADHLARHPQQTVTSMKLSVGYHRFFDAEKGEFHFGIDVRRRGETRSGGASGLCYDRETGVGCYVDCDGGGFLLRPAGQADAILLDMTHVGSLAIFAECGMDEDEELSSLPPLVPGTDDKIFLLRRTAPGDCDVSPGGN